MSHERTIGERPVTAIGGPARTLDVLFVLGACALLPVTPCLIAATLLPDRDVARLLIGWGFLVAAAVLLCWGLSGVLLYRHPESPWPVNIPQHSSVTRRESAFVFAWCGFVSASGLVVLGPLTVTLGFLHLPAWLWTLGAPIVIVLIGAPACIVLLRARRRTQEAR